MRECSKSWSREDSGQEHLFEVGDVFTDSDVNHFVGGLRVASDDAPAGDSFEGKYLARGIVIIKTVCDGDCGIHALCMVRPSASQRCASPVHNQLVIN